MLSSMLSAVYMTEEGHSKKKDISNNNIQQLTDHMLLGKQFIFNILEFWGFKS